MSAILIQSKQIKKLMAGYVRVSAFSFPAASSGFITSALSTALSTAGFGGNSVPLANSTAENITGVITSGNNRVEIYKNSDKEKLDYLGQEVYGRVTQSLGAYTLSLYSIQAGVETAYTSAALSLDFEVPYRFEFKDLPTDFAIAIKERNTNDDDNHGIAGRLYKELLVVSAPNIVSNLTFTPNFTYEVSLFVNGKEETNVGASPPFTTAGKVITWSAVNAKYALATDDRVVAIYTTLE